MGRTRPQLQSVETEFGQVRFEPEVGRDAFMLTIDGTSQSHVDLTDPARLEFTYIRVMARVLDLTLDPPADVLHLGGAGCTLARYLAARFPAQHHGVRQQVVEINGALAEMVRAAAPLSKSVKLRVADAREVVASARDGRYRAVVVDLFDQGRVPRFVGSDEFLQALRRIVTADGVVVANITDGAGLGYARQFCAGLATLFSHGLVAGETGVLKGRRFGNLVVAGSPAELPVAELRRRLASDPFPIGIIAGEQFTEFHRDQRFAGPAGPIPPAPPSGALAF